MNTNELKIQQLIAAEWKMKHKEPLPKIGDEVQFVKGDEQYSGEVDAYCVSFTDNECEIFFTVSTSPRRAYHVEIGEFIFDEK